MGKEGLIVVRQTLELLHRRDHCWQLDKRSRFRVKGQGEATSTSPSHFANIPKWAHIPQEALIQRSALRSVAGAKATTLALLSSMSSLPWILDACFNAQVMTRLRRAHLTSLSETLVCVCASFFQPSQPCLLSPSEWLLNEAALRGITRSAAQRAS